VIAMCAGCHRDAQQVGLGEGTTFQNENWAASKSLADTAINPGHVRFTPESRHGSARS